MEVRTSAERTASVSPRWRPAGLQLRPGVDGWRKELVGEISELCAYNQDAGSEDEMPDFQAYGGRRERAAAPRPAAPPPER